MIKEINDYWHHDFPIDTDVLKPEWIPGFGLRMKAHLAREHYNHLSTWDEIVPILPRHGERLYFQGKPYVLEPDIRVTVGRRPGAGGALGQVESTEWAGLRQREIGNAQGWFYTEARTLVLWECLLDASVGQASEPDADPLLACVFHDWEKFLVTHSPGAERIVTPSWEPLFEPRERWQRFLTSMGYQPLVEQAFAKPITEV